MRVAINPKSFSIMRNAAQETVELAFFIDSKEALQEKEKRSKEETFSNFMHIIVEGFALHVRTEK